MRHSVAEEQDLHPERREHAEGGARLADKEIADHGRVEEILEQLETGDAESAQMSPLLQQRMAEVADHVEDEESNLFPMLRHACTPEQPNNLGDKVRPAKATAPTRPHPSAPSTPTASKLSPSAGLVDGVRGFATGRGKS